MYAILAGSRMKPYLAPSLGFVSVSEYVRVRQSTFLNDLVLLGVTQNARLQFYQGKRIGPNASGYQWQFALYIYCPSMWLEKFEYVTKIAALLFLYSPCVT